MTKIYTVVYTDTTDIYDVVYLEESYYMTESSAIRRYEEIKKSLIEEGYKINEGEDGMSLNGIVIHHNDLFDEDMEYSVSLYVGEIEAED